MATDGTPANTFEAQHLVCVRGERPVFGGVDFRVVSGQALLLKGPNGSGKSSLMRILAGLLSPAGGALTWAGEPVFDALDEHRQRLHYVGHMDGIKPAATVAEHVAFWAHLRGADQPDADALSKVGLEGLADVPGRFLSAGQRRRVSLARLVATPAPLWLLDEPTVTLDVEATARLEALIAAHRETGGIVVVATHTDIKMEDATLLDMAGHRAGMVAVNEMTGSVRDAKTSADEAWDQW